MIGEWKKTIMSKAWSLGIPMMKAFTNVECDVRNDDETFWKCRRVYYNY
jgi:hypothetical protein